MDNEPKMVFIKNSADNQWSMYEYKNRYYFYHSEKNGPPEIVRTPKNKIVDTSYLLLAERILEDLGKYGYCYTLPESILSWHFTLLDAFLDMEHSEVETVLEQSFLSGNDWSFIPNDTVPRWEKLFGKMNEREASIKSWLSKCSYMQMTAACCIGNALSSINVAYVLALIMENYTGASRKHEFSKLIEMINADSIFGSDEDVEEIFKTFELYYGIHLDEDGPLLNIKIDDIEDDDTIRDGYLNKEGTGTAKQPSPLDICLGLLPYGQKLGYVTSQEAFPSIPEIMCQARDVSSYLLDRMIVEYDTLTVLRLGPVWAAYAAMGAVRFWHDDYDQLKSKGLIQSLTEPRGIEEMDEFVMDHIGWGFKSEKATDFGKHLIEMSRLAMDMAANKSIDPGVLFGCYINASMAMFYYGMIIEMNDLGLN